MSESKLTRASEIDFGRPVLCRGDGSDEPIRNAFPVELVWAANSEANGNDGLILVEGEWCVVI